MTDGHHAAKLRKAIGGMLKAISGTHSPDRELLDTYVQALSDLDPAAVLGAIDESVRTSERHVPPAKLRRMVLGEASSGAEEAWRFYVARLRQVGVIDMRSTDHPDGRAQEALRTIGGAPALNVPEAELRGVRDRFIQAYSAPDKVAAS